jgi:hypothetical protein
MTDENIDSITVEELNEALKTSKIQKSPGYDGINIELVKHAGLALHYRHLDFLNICRNFGYVPEEWNTAIVIPLFKKRDRAICDNYRGISLLCTVCKIYAKIIARRIGGIIEPLISEEQKWIQKRSLLD